MSEGFKSKFAVFSGLATAGYIIYLFLATSSVNVVAIEPTDCRKLRSLPGQHYDHVEYFAILKLKGKAKRAGADTLYAPPNMLNLINKKKVITGVAYDCAGS